MISILKIKEEIAHHIKVLLFAALFALISSFITGCNVAKIEQRKDNAAIERSTSKLSNLQRVAEIVRERFPCVPIETFRDTGKTIIKEVKTHLPPIKIPFEIYKWKQFNFDTLINGLSIYVDSNGLVITGEYLCKEKIIHITTKTRDDELINRQKDTINSLRVQIGVKNGITQELRTTISELKKENNHLKWYLAGSFLLLILSHVIRSYIPKIKIPFIKS